MTDEQTAAIVTIDGYQVSSEWDDGQPRIPDDNLAERCGYARPREIRTRIKRLEKDGELPGLRFRCTVQRNEKRGRGRSAPGQYHLTEEEALIVVMGCETAIARRVRREVIRVFMAWRAGTLAPVSHALTPQVDAARFEALQEQVMLLTARISELSGGTILPSTHRQLRSEVRILAQLERAVRHWSSVRAATADIYREMGRVTGWGGKGQQWKYLPAGLTHAAFVVLRDRMASVRREQRVLVADNQLDLPLH